MVKIILTIGTNNWDVEKPTGRNWKKTKILLNDGAKIMTTFINRLL
jgi:hypothetical protein